MGCFACFKGGNKHQRKEQERLASAEARARAAEAAQKRGGPEYNQHRWQEQFEKSAAGRAARTQMEKMAKKSANYDKGEPVLKWQMN